ncbi:MAG: hypothetical protein COB24_14685 [Hyphomicrobiales bacterium]|nr:MAG: hypothetical protein COB24_14685 [Hyphomicrobiales bacterium]
MGIICVFNPLYNSFTAPLGMNYEYTQTAIWKITGWNTQKYYRDSLLYLMMIFVTFTGILVSEAALPLLGFTIESDSFWHIMHHNSINLLFPMLGIHLALHGTWIVKISKYIFSSE